MLNTSSSAVSNFLCAQTHGLSPLTLLLGMGDCVQTGIRDVGTSSVASNVNHPECFFEI